MSCKSRWGYSRCHQTHWPAFSAADHTIPPPCTGREHRWWPLSFPGSTRNEWLSRLAKGCFPFSRHQCWFRKWPFLCLLLGGEISGATLLASISIPSSGMRACCSTFCLPSYQEHVWGPGGQRAVLRTCSLMPEPGGAKVCGSCLTMAGAHERAGTGAQDPLHTVLPGTALTRVSTSWVTSHWFPVLSSEPCLYKFHLPQSGAEGRWEVGR